MPLLALRFRCHARTNVGEVSERSASAKCAGWVGARLLTEAATVVVAAWSGGSAATLFGILARERPDESRDP